MKKHWPTPAVTMLFCSSALISPDLRYNSTRSFKSFGESEKIIEYWLALITAVDWRWISGVPTKSLIFCVITICIPEYLRIRFAICAMKSKAIGYSGLMKTWASSTATIIFLFVLKWMLKSLFLIISLSKYLKIKSICALAITSFRFARRERKLNETKFSFVEIEVGPFQRLLFLPPVANFLM